jgi:hypothetical protein
MSDGLRPKLTRDSGTSQSRYAYYIRCERIKRNKEQCKAPALKGTRVCYKHTQQDEAESRRAQTIRKLGLPSLNNAYSLQTALERVVKAILLGEIDDRTAGIVLRQLQGSVGFTSAGQRSEL